MSDCLSGKNTTPDRREKIHDWDVFTALILSTWIRRFTSDNTAANMTAEQWAAVVTAAFEKGTFDRKAYETAYRDILRPSGGRLLNPANFYPVSLLNGCLNIEAEEAFVEWLITQEDGIYYIYTVTLSKSFPKCLRADRQAAFWELSNCSRITVAQEINLSMWLIGLKQTGN